MIEEREQPAAPPKNPKRQVVEERRTPTATLRLELVACGKGACKVCGGGKRPAHGPYWYAYWKQDGRTRSKYIGKELLLSAQDRNGTPGLRSRLHRH